MAQNETMGVYTGSRNPRVNPKSNPNPQNLKSLINHERTRPAIIR